MSAWNNGNWVQFAGWVALYFGLLAFVFGVAVWALGEIVGD